MSAVSPNCSQGDFLSDLATIGVMCSIALQDTRDQRTCRSMATCSKAEAHRSASFLPYRQPYGSGDATRTRCNVSSWYVDPEFRIYAVLLISRAIGKKNITYLQLTPSDHVLPIVEAQGFSRFSDGLFVVPIFPMIQRGPSAKVVAHDVIPNARFEPFERDLTVGSRRIWLHMPLVRDARNRLSICISSARDKAYYPMRSANPLP